MKKSKKLLQINWFIPIIPAMRKKLRLAMIAAAAFCCVAFVSSALADEHLTPAQTTLTPTSIENNDVQPFDFSGSDDSPIGSSIVFSATPSFSPTPAPEPSTFTLASMAIGLLAVVRLSRRQQVLKR